MFVVYILNLGILGRFIFFELFFHNNTIDSFSELGDMAKVKKEGPKSSNDYKFHLLGLRPEGSPITVATLKAADMKNVPARARACRVGFTNDLIPDLNRLPTEMTERPMTMRLHIAIEDALIHHIGLLTQAASPSCGRR